MPTLGVCIDSVLETEGPLALIDFLEAAQSRYKSTAQAKHENTSNRMGSSTRNLNRRASKRADFSYRLLIKPIKSSVTQDTNQFAPEAMYVTGKDLSDIGLGFFHDAPFPYRKAIIEAADDRLDAMGLGDMRLALTIRWCRFIGQGQYESGSRIGWPT